VSGRIEPGSILGGSYRVVRSIEKGRMGEVFEAAHVRLGGRYAVKMLSPEVRSHPELLQQLAHDARVTSSLRHPSILQFIDFDTAPDGSPYLVVELLEGEELGQVLARDGRLPLARTIAITRQIASALAAAHRQDVIHRDLTPHDIFLLPAVDDDKERIKVLDFGMWKLRRVVQKAEDLAPVVGTAHFVAPEQVEGEEDVDAAVDQFSLAAIVYEMLAGQPAFRSESPATVTDRIVPEAPTPLAQVRPELPAGIGAVLARALSKNRTQRFPSIAEFSRELRLAAQAGEAATGAEGLASPSSEGSEVTVNRVLPREPGATDVRSDVAVRDEGREADSDARPQVRPSETSAPVVLQAHPRTERAALVPAGGSGTTFRLSGAPRPAGNQRARLGAPARFRQILGSPRVRPALGAAGAIALVVIASALMRGGRSSALPASGSAAPVGATLASGQVSSGAPPSPGQAVAANGVATKPGPTIEPIIEPIEPIKRVDGTAAPAPSGSVAAKLAPTVEAASVAFGAVNGTGGAGGDLAGLPFELASEPPGLPVWIDGKPYPDAERQARTWTRGMLPAGVHRVEIVAKEGYEPWRKTVEIRADRANRFMARLKAKDPDAIAEDLSPSPAMKPAPATQPATTPAMAGLVPAALVKPAAPPVPRRPALDGACALSVGSLPWATIWVDGQSTGRHTPTVALPLPCGKHLLHLKRDDQPIDFTTEIVLIPGAVLKRVFHFGAAGQRLAK
jgi:serine/threonine protein kinase